MDGGKLKPWNVRLAHVFCNNIDFGWRKRIRRLLEKDPALSFERIAEVLNRSTFTGHPGRSPGRRSSFAERMSRSEKSGRGGASLIALPWLA
jgi:hypothetical protein